MRTLSLRLERKEVVRMESIAGALNSIVKIMSELRATAVGVGAKRAVGLDVLRAWNLLALRFQAVRG